ncbi:MAG: hypothetical protein WBA76_17910 [Phormidesmis sp.]
MKTNFPLFESVLALDEVIKERFPQNVCSGLEALGTIFTGLDCLENGGYHATPTNTLSFARTGTDGEHFSFLVFNNRIDSRSPVIFTTPVNYGGIENVVVAKNFDIFVRLWLRYGGFALGEFAYNIERAIQVYTTEQQQPAEKLSTVFDYAPDEQMQKILDFAAKALRMQPYIYTAAEFLALQRRYLPLLQMPDGYYLL